MGRCRSSGARAGNVDRIEARGDSLTVHLRTRDEPLSSRKEEASSIEEILRDNGVPVGTGEGAVQIVRGTMGATNPADAAPGTIRADFAVDLGRNVVHGSDSPESGEREVGLFFEPDELVEWTRDSERWIRE